MHEFPEVQAMVRDACARLPAGKAIRKLVIVVGEASGHDPDHIAGHFDEAAAGTAAAGAALEFVIEKLLACCANCGAGFDGAGSAFACPQCGGTELEIIAGRAVRLDRVEW